MKATSCVCVCVRAILNSTSAYTCMILQQKKKTQNEKLGKATSTMALEKSQEFIVQLPRKCQKL